MDRHNYNPQEWASSGRRFDALILFVDSFVPLSSLETLSAHGPEGNCHPSIEDLSISIRISREVTAYEGIGYKALASNSVCAKHFPNTD